MGDRCLCCTTGALSLRGETAQGVSYVMCDNDDCGYRESGPAPELENPIADLLRAYVRGEVGLGRVLPVARAIAVAVSPPEEH